MWQNAVNSEDIFDENDHFIPEADDYVNNPERNGFIATRFHWSEDPSKDENWYIEQKRDFNFDTRLINQELDLVFVGSTNCIFSDEFLGSLKAKRPVDRIKLPHQTEVKLFTHRHHFDKTDYLLIGVDTAKSMTGDYCALELYTYANFVQIGEYFGRLGSLSKYSEVIVELVKTLLPLTNNRIILCIENNSIGASIIEDLENESSEQIDFSQYIYSPDPEKTIGINTNSKTRSIMVSHFYDLIIDEPNNIVSKDLINQLNIIERKASGKVEAQSGYHDDLFMASSLCAYTRRLSALEYEPLLGVSTAIQQQRHTNQISNALSSPPLLDATKDLPIGVKYNQEEGGIEYIISDDIEDEYIGDDNLTPFTFV